MKKKREAITLILPLIVVLLSAVAISQSVDYTEKINKAFECLDNELRTAPSLTLEEAIFSSLVGADDDKIWNTIDNAKSSNTECWGTSGCNVKETAQVILARKNSNKNIDGAIDWLKNQTNVPKDLIWYLQITIDNNQEATCKIGYDGSDKTIIVKNDLTLSGEPGSCLTIDENNYWLRISNNCVDKTFSISCDWIGEGESFLSNIVYREQVGGTTFVSSNTKSSAKGGFQEQKINAKCFANSAGNCDYEGSLWAVTALYKTDEEFSDYVPYLLGLSESNQQFFPEAFLKFILGQGNNGDQFDAINSKVSNGHWNIAGGYSQYVDTGLAMIALGGAEHTTNYNTLGWLFSEGEQTSAGCWNNNNIRDTAFIIFGAGWGLETSGGGGGGGGGTPGGITPGNQSCSDVSGTCRTNCSTGEISVSSECSTSGELCCKIDSGGGYDPNFQDDCELKGYYCGDRLACLESLGSVLPNNQCLSFAEVCCSVQPVEIENCASLGGEICGVDEQCSTSVVQASDGACCVSGTCRAITGGTNEDDQTGDGGTTSPEKGGNLWIWITILVILILLALVGIIYRNKIKLWWYKRKGRVKTQGIEPPSSGLITGRRPPPRFGPPIGFMPRAAPVRKTGGDREMEETLKKLKEISQ